MSFFNWFTTCIDVGPEGFTTPKRPDRGSEGDLGMVAGYERADLGADRYEIELVSYNLVTRAYIQARRTVSCYDCLTYSSTV